MISGLVLKYLNGECFVIKPGYETARPVSSSFCLTVPEYGLRTHPAEEIYIMLAGSAFWKVTDSPYQQLFPRERSHHQSMVPHSTRTGEDAFMSIYVWDGDIATDEYRYFGLPDDEDKAG